MGSVLLPEEAIEKLQAVQSLLETDLTMVKTLRTDFERKTELLKLHQKAVETCLENFIKPFISAIEGVSKTADSLRPRGAGAGDGQGIIFPSDCVETIAVSHSDLDLPTDRITQTDFEGGRHCVSIPEEIAKRIADKYEIVEEIIRRFHRVGKNITREAEFDFQMRSAICELKNELEISYEEGEILFRLFMAEFLNQD